MPNTQERLAEYADFSPAVADRVSEVIDQQRSMSFREFFAEYNIPEPETVCFDGQMPNQILDIKPDPRIHYDETRALVVRLAIDNAIDDPNQMYQMASLFAVDPTTRLIAIGNPSAPGHGAGRLSKADRSEVRKNGNLKPLVEPSFSYLEREKIRTVRNLGFSFGATTTLVATAEAGDHEVEETRVIENADNVFRGEDWRALISLARDFGKTLEPLDNYALASDVPAFIEARKQSPAPGLLGMGLLRLTNIVQASILAGDFFESRAEAALKNQPNSDLIAIWGQDSELAHDRRMSDSMRFLMNHPEFRGRVGAIRVKNGMHNMVNDLALHMALAHQPVKTAV